MATAGLNAADVAHPVRGLFHRQRNLRVLMGEVTGVDWDGREVILADHQPVPYDHLVVATGAVATWFGVPGAAELKRWALSALSDEVRGELTLRVVGESESAELNSRYRGKRGPTNVLSFKAEPPPPAAGETGEVLPFGDVVICAEVVEREAREQGKRPAAHWAHMVVHGALHLQGYDHENRRDRGLMEARERAVLDALGFPDPYSIK